MILRMLLMMKLLCKACHLAKASHTTSKKRRAWSKRPRNQKLAKWNPGLNLYLLKNTFIPVEIRQNSKSYCKIPPQLQTTICLQSHRTSHDQCNSWRWTVQLTSLLLQSSCQSLTLIVTIIPDKWSKKFPSSTLKNPISISRIKRLSPYRAKSTMRPNHLNSELITSQPAS